MSYINPNEIIGKTVEYYDFMGEKVIGTIGGFSSSPSLPEDVVYLFIVDEDPKENDKIETLYINGVLTRLQFADMERSDNVIMHTKTLF